MFSDRTGRQPFRFRFPWSSQLLRPTQTPPRPPLPPASQSQPTIPSQQLPRFPPQETTTTASHPPAQPKSQPQTQPQPPARTQPQPPSPSRIPAPPQAATRAASQPPSPSRMPAPPQPATRPTYQPRSPSRISAQSQPATQAATQPPSPSRMPAQSQPATRAASQPPSPSRRASQPPSPSRTARTASPSQTMYRDNNVPQAQPQPQLVFQPKPSPETSFHSPSEPRAISEKAQSQPQHPSTFQKITQLQPLPTRQAQTEPSSQPQPQAQQTTTQLVDQTTGQVAAQIDKVANQRSNASASEATPTAKPTIVPKPHDTPPESSQMSKFNGVPTPDAQLPKGKTETELKSGETQDCKLEIQQELKPEKKQEGKIPDMVSSKKHMGHETDMKAQQTAETKIKEQKRQEKQMLVDMRAAAPAPPKLISLSSADAGSRGEGNKITISINPKTKNVDKEMHPRAVTAHGEQTHHQQSRERISRIVNKITKGYEKQLGEQPGIRVITLAGENKGASMHIGSNSTRGTSVHIHRSYKLSKDDEADKTSDAEESPKGKGKLEPKGRAPITACINSNIQGINNSILYNSSSREKNPGVHLSLPSNRPEAVEPKGGKETLEIRKSESKLTPPQKLTSDVTVRRRCLRGLFMESSESDPDNPEKPRRHGCRYNCAEKKRENDKGEDNSAETSNRTQDNEAPSKE